MKLLGLFALGHKFPCPAPQTKLSLSSSDPDSISWLDSLCLHSQHTPGPEDSLLTYLPTQPKAPLGPFCHASSNDQHHSQLKASPKTIYFMSELYPLYPNLEKTRNNSEFRFPVWTPTPWERSVSTLRPHPHTTHFCRHCRNSLRDLRPLDACKKPRTEGKHNVLCYR